MSTGIQVIPQTAITIGTTPITSGVAGRVLFEGSGNVVQEDGGLFWDNVNKRLGVGTSTPSQAIDVSGNIKLNNSSQLMWRNAANNADIPILQLTNSNILNIGTTSSSIPSSIILHASSVAHLRLFSTGNLMLQNGGTFTDSGAKLHITAQGALSTDIAFRIRNAADTLDIIRANGAGEVFVGLGAGRISTGFGNSFFGASAGYSNTTGTGNTANGLAALYNSTGNSNTANGTYALFSNTTGSSNAINGYQALYFNTTGNNNIALGRDSGRYIADGTTANSITNNSVYLGNNTKALANNQTNQIVIGYEATGLGSNTAVLGNDSITLTGLKGNVAIGATTASAKLDVRAQGALSTDVAFRVRNSADTGNLMSVSGNNTISFFTNNYTNGGIEYILDTLQPYSTARFGIDIALSSYAGEIRGKNIRVGAERISSNYLGLNIGSVWENQLKGVDQSGNVNVLLNLNSFSNNTIFDLITRSNNNTNFINFSGNGTNNKFTISDQSNVAIGGSTFGTSSKFVISQFTGTAPTTSPADAFQQYSADITAGNAAPHFRTENGSIVKLYQETTAVTAATLTSNLGTILTDTDTFDGYTMKQVVKALRNMGILA